AARALLAEFAEAAAVAVEHGAAEVRAEAGERQRLAVEAPQRRQRRAERDALVGAPDAALAANQHRLGRDARLGIAPENDGAARRIVGEQARRRDRLARFELERHALDVGRAEDLDQPRLARAGVDRADALAGNDHPVGADGACRDEQAGDDDDEPAPHLTKLLSWMIGNRTARTISMTTPPM